jgi:hypothetical protein
MRRAVPVRKSRTTSCWPTRQDGLQRHHDRYRKGDIYLMTQDEEALEHGDVTVEDALLRRAANTKQIDTRGLTTARETQPAKRFSVMLACACNS